MHYSFQSFSGYIESEIGKSSLNFAPAIESQEKHEYEKSIVEFVTDLSLLNVSEVVTKPPDANIIGSRLVCKNKYDSNQNLLKYKSRLTPLGYQQKHGVA